MESDDDYGLPERYSDAYHVCGDGVWVLVVRHVAWRVLEPALVAHERSELIAVEKWPSTGFRRRAVRTLTNDIGCYAG
jgi:hypothetical protein